MSNADRFASQADTPGLPPKVSERLKTVNIVVQGKLNLIRQRIGHERWKAYYEQAYALLESPDPLWIKLRALYRIADELAEFVKPNAACKRGCSHCCHIGVYVMEPEARMIGMAIKRKPKKVQNRNFDNFRPGYHNPCTFLKNGECSIYEHRPLACRQQLNLDDDALLCEFTSPHPTPVPYFNMAFLSEVYVRLCLKSKHADIRDYFPL